MILKLTNSRSQVDARLKDLRKQLKELNSAYAQSEDWLKVRCFNIFKDREWLMDAILYYTGTAKRGSNRWGGVKAVV